MNAAASIERARSLMELDRAGEAVKILQGVLAEEPDNGYAHSVLAYAYGDRPEAVQHAHEGTRLDPDEPYALRSAAWAHIRANNAAEAVDFASQLVRSVPTSSDAHCTLSNAYLAKSLPRKTDRAAARDAAMKATSLAPHSAQAWEQLARVEYGANNLLPAEQHVRKALSINPASQSARNLLSGLQLEDNNVASAAEILRGLIAEDPSDQYYSRRFDDLLAKVMSDLLWLAAPVAIFLFFVVLSTVGA